MNLYVVVVIDRHADPEVTIFDNKKTAENYAQAYAITISKESGFVPEDNEEFGPDGLIRSIIYSNEDDCVYIYNRMLTDNVSDKTVTTED